MVAEIVVDDVVDWRVSECEWSGEILVGFHVYGCPGFSDWLLKNLALLDVMCTGDSSAIVIGTSIDHELAIVGNANLEVAKGSSERSGRYNCRDEEN